MKRTTRNSYRPATQQDIPKGGMKRTTRRVERAQLKRSTAAELKDWRRQQSN